MGSTSNMQARAGSTRKFGIEFLRCIVQRRLRRLAGGDVGDGSLKGVEVERVLRRGRPSGGALLQLLHEYAPWIFLELGRTVNQGFAGWQIAALIDPFGMLLAREPVGQQPRLFHI